MKKKEDNKGYVVIAEKIDKAVNGGYCHVL